MANPKILIWASGTKTGGGSGFENLVASARDPEGDLQAEIVAVVSNHAAGGVRERAERLSVPFIHFPSPHSAEDYQRIAAESGASWHAFSGWLKFVRGLSLQTSFGPHNSINIHPGPLPLFGGQGMYGIHVHREVLDSFRQGLVKHSAVTMHFVTDDYDRGPVFFSQPVEIKVSDTPESLAARVNRTEHRYQPLLTNLVVRGLVHWDGVDYGSLVVPELPEPKRL